MRTRFEALGGDSLLAVRMLADVSERLGRDVPYLVFAEDGTIEALASALESLPASTASALVALRAGGSDAPLYCIPGHDGALHGIDRLARALPATRPVWAFDVRHLDRAASVEDLAARCLDLLLAHDPHGPYHIAGLCFGGSVATELARQLIARGKRVEFLGLIDALNPAWRRAVTPLDAARARRAQLTEKSRYHGAALREMSVGAGLRYLARRGSRSWAAQENSSAPESAAGRSRRTTFGWRRTTSPGRSTPTPLSCACWADDPMWLTSAGRASSPRASRRWMCRLRPTAPCRQAASTVWPSFWASVWPETRPFKTGIRRTLQVAGLIRRRPRRHPSIAFPYDSWHSRMVLP